ncbi:hypothetical protein PT286_05640 [Neisseriaceae bacterium ESL0693]|nr:hypothetical protein [Neisseriaceae bacterium ESL0693]
MVWADDSTCLIPDYYAEQSLNAHWQHQTLSSWRQTSLKPYADSASIMAYLDQIATKAFQQPKVPASQQSEQLYRFVRQIHHECIRDLVQSDHSSDQTTPDQ